MSEFTVFLQPAFILQHRKYRETSLILDVLTRDFGIVSVLAKGVRKKKSKTAGLLLAFNALRISYLGKNELKILTHVELDSPLKALSGLSLYCGFYVNELVSFLLHKNDPSPEVFIEYKHCLTLLEETQETEQVLRFFELNLMEYIGYGIQLSIDISSESQVIPEKKYCYNAGFGMTANIDGYISGRTLLDLESRNTLSKQARHEAKTLMRRVIDSLLQGRVLKSRAVLAKIIKQI